MQTHTKKVKVRRAFERGHANHGWLNSYHTFSFGGYYDPEYVGFRSLRVINDDTVAPGMGFGTHPHHDMEIISVVLDGALEHKDSMGNGSAIQTGQVQRISAGAGISHSEFNHSDQDPVHFLQIWIQPNVRGLEPSYAEVNVVDIPTRDGLKLIASPDGAENSIVIHQDALLFMGQLAKGESKVYVTQHKRGSWIHVTHGQLKIFDHTLNPGDAISVEGVSQITIHSSSETEFLWFDLK